MRSEQVRQVLNAGGLAAMLTIYPGRPEGLAALDG
jgi:hypothetical protein